MSNTYFQTAVGVLDGPGSEPDRDGERLAQECLAKIDLERFPPKLFILWLTPAFRSSYLLVLQGIRSKLEDLGYGNVPLIGTSVAACVAEKKVLEEGGVLICLASRMLSATTSVSAQVDASPEEAIRSAVTKLTILPGRAVNQFDNQFLLAFLPGYARRDDYASYRAAEYVRELRTLTNNRIPILGGVSSAGQNVRDMGFQFHDGAVHSQSVVLALVTTEIAHGWGLSHGLVEIESPPLKVMETSDDGRVITQFANGEARSVLEGMNVTCPVLSVANSETGQPYYATPILHAANRQHVHVLRPVSAGASVKVCQPNSQTMQSDVWNARSRAHRRNGIRTNEFEAVLGFCCVSRYRERKQIGFDIERALRLTDRKGRVKTHVACYLDGEIGLDNTGLPDATNWAVSELLLFDEIPASNLYRLGFEALSEPIATDDVKVEEVMAIALERVWKAGYPGGMISLALSDGNRKVIRGVRSVGKAWEKVRERTNRPLDVEEGRPVRDVLALVCSQKLTISIFDAQKDNRSDCALAKEAGIRSFIAMPLTYDGEGIGVLQIDLDDIGENKRLSEEQSKILESFGRRVSSALGRAARKVETRFFREMERVCHRLEAGSSPAEAGGPFIQFMCAELNVDAHLRILDASRTGLELIGGAGAYFEAAQSQRRAVPLNDGSPSATIFHDKEPKLINDAIGDGACLSLAGNYASTPLEAALKRMASFVDYPILASDGTALGVVSFYHDTPWYFTFWKVNQIKDAVRRLEVLLNYSAAQQASQIAQSRLSVLHELTTRINLVSAFAAGRWSRSSLNELFAQQARHLHEILKADIVSCFIMDPIQRRYVLRGQTGWSDPSWVGAASFDPDEGIIGTVAAEPQPVRVVDLKAFESQSVRRRVRNVGKYNEETFGERLTGQHKWEALFLPFWDTTYPGIIAVYRQSATSDRSPFSLLTQELLEDIVRLNRAFFVGLLAKDESLWQQQEIRHLAEIGDMLTSATDRSKLCTQFCAHVGRVYGAARTDLYLYDSNKPRLVREAWWPERVEPIPPYQIESSKNLRWQSLAYLGRQEATWATAIDQKNPKFVRRERYVRQLSVPIPGSESKAEPVAIFTLTWRGIPDFSTTGRIIRHNPKVFVDLARRFGAAYDILQMREVEAGAAREQAELKNRIAALAQVARAHEFVRPVGLIGDSLVQLRTFVQSEGIRHFHDIETRFRSLNRQVEKFKQITQQFSKPIREPIRIDCLVSDVLANYEARIRLHNIKKLPRLTEVTICGNPELISELVRVLVDNAVGALEQSSEQPTLVVHVDKAPRGCRLIVTDNGVGMRQEQLDATLAGNGGSSKPEGMGIGLLLARVIAEQHGGQLTGASSPGAGCTFRVTLEGI